MVFDYDRFYNNIDLTTLQAICKECKTGVKFTKSSETNLQKHLSANHPKLLKQYEVKDGDNQAKLNSSGGELNIVLPGKKKTVNTHFAAQQSVITDSIVVNLVCRSNMPLHLTENPHFRQFLSDIERRYSPPCYRSVVLRRGTFFTVSQANRQRHAACKWHTAYL